MLRILRRLYNTRHDAETPLSEEQILAQLREVEMSLVRDQNTQRHFVIPSAANRTKIRLYKALGMTIQRQTVPVESDVTVVFKSPGIRLKTNLILRNIRYF